MAAPLLKWEKEQQDKGSRPKRRSGGRPGEGRGDELGFDTDSGEELVNQMLSPNELVDESVLDLVFGEAKRQRC